MAENVRPRINPVTYELVKCAALSSCISTGQYIDQALREKAQRDGWKIVDGKIIRGESNISGSTVHQPQNVYAAPEEI